MFEQNMTYPPKNYKYNGLAVPMEFWKPITDEMVPGIRPIYWISNIGNVYNSKRDLYFNINKNTNRRYLSVTLQTDKGAVSVQLHRLVCMAFNGMPVPPYDTVDHKNFDKHCNYEGNLEWVTQEENYRRAYNAGRMSKDKSEEGSTTICKE